MRARVYVFVRFRVFLCPFTVQVSPYCNDARDINQGTTQLCCVENVRDYASAIFCHFCIYQISPPKTNFRQQHTRKKRFVIYDGVKWYISALASNRQVTNRLKRQDVSAILVHQLLSCNWNWNFFPLGIGWKKTLFYFQT